MTGATATAFEKRGAFTGTVALVGEPWKWNAWTTTANLPGGMVVTAKDTRDGGTLRATKEAKQGDQLIVTMTDDLTAFDCAEFDAKRDALAPK